MGQVELIDRIVEEIKPVLAGHNPAIQGAALAELLAIWVLGHRRETPARTEALREELIAHQIHFVRMRMEIGEEPTNGQ